MSRTIKMIGVLALVAVFGIASTGLASPPVPGPTETFTIETETIIDCYGTVTETESFGWTYGTGGFWIDPTTGSVGFSDVGDSAAQIRYEENFEAIDGATQFAKSFKAESAPATAPNLAVSKTFGYIGDTISESMIASLSESEKVGIGVVAYGEALAGTTIAGLEGICPWSGSSRAATIPATNEFITMGSTVKTGVSFFADTPAIVAAKTTKATTTLSPALSHEVTGSGYGEITAWMALHLQEANGIVTEDTADSMWIVPPLVSETRYNQNTAAKGVIVEFGKSMKYTTSIPSVTPLSTWDSMFD